MAPSLTITTIHTLNILIGILSISILGLLVHTITLTDSIEHSFPPNLKDTGRTMLFWPGVGGIVDMLLFAFLWAMKPSAVTKTKKSTIYANAILFVACFILARPLITLIYTFVEWGQAVKNNMQPQSGYVTTEAWACAAANENTARGAGSICGELRTARYLLVPEVILAAVMVLLVIKLRRDTSKANRTVEVKEGTDTRA